jgi:hypothetical protein
MLGFLKYIPILLKFKDVTKVWKAEGLDVSTKPFWLSRRFVGVVLIIISGILTSHFGIKIAEADVKTFADALIGLAQAATVIYGSVEVLVGYFKRNKDVKLGLKIKKEGGE